MEKKKNDKQRTEKRPYEKPVIIESAPFEALTLACNFAAGQNRSCSADPGVS